MSSIFIKNPESIWIRRREVEKKSGRAIVFRSAYPTIGRGSVYHKTVPHQDVEMRVSKALRINRTVDFLRKLGLHD